MESAFSTTSSPVKKAPTQIAKILQKKSTDAFAKLAMDKTTLFKLSTKARYLTTQKKMRQLVHMAFRNTEKKEELAKTLELYRKLSQNGEQKKIDKKNYTAQLNRLSRANVTTTSKQLVEDCTRTSAHLRALQAVGIKQATIPTHLNIKKSHADAKKLPAAQAKEKRRLALQK
jgi:hypothetical protein